jgi:hypothetical protein
MEVVTVEERPDLIERAFEGTYDTLREYNHHGDVLNRYWGRLTEEPPEFQFHLLDDGEEILARARASRPLGWKHRRLARRDRRRDRPRLR